MTEIGPAPVAVVGGAEVVPPAPAVPAVDAASLSGRTRDSIFVVGDIELGPVGLDAVDLLRYVLDLQPGLRRAIVALVDVATIRAGRRIIHGIAGREPDRAGKQETLAEIRVLHHTICQTDIQASVVGIHSPGTFIP